MTQHKSIRMGVQKVGAINNRYTVYKNPYMLENDMVVSEDKTSLKQASFDHMYPLIMTPLVYDPKNFTPRKGDDKMQRRWFILNSMVRS